MQVIEQVNADSCTLHPLDSEGGVALVSEVCGLGFGVPSVLLDRKKIGPRARDRMQDLVREHEQTKPTKVLVGVLKSGSFKYEAGIELREDDYEFSLESVPERALAARGNIVASVSSSRSPEAAARGLIRDVARRIQALRKEHGYDPAEILAAASVLDLKGEAAEAVRAGAKELASLVRVQAVEFAETCSEYKKESIDGAPVRIGLRR